MIEQDPTRIFNTLERQYALLLKIYGDPTLPVFYKAWDWMLDIYGWTHQEFERWMEIKYPHEPQ